MCKHSLLQNELCKTTPFRKCHSFWRVAPINHKKPRTYFYLTKGGWVRKKEHTQAREAQSDQAGSSSCCAGLSQTLTFTESDLTERHSFVLSRRKGKPTAGSPQHFSDVTTANIHQCVLQRFFESCLFLCRDTCLTWHSVGQHGMCPAKTQASN